jgi:Zn-dependent peptidase ImmA (M78 family)
MAKKAATTYDVYFKELLSWANLIGVNVIAEKSDDFDVDTLGAYDPFTKSISLYYGDKITKDAETLFIFAHELRHAFQHATGLFSDFWMFALELGDRPSTELKDAMEDDADEWATAFLKGRGIRVPKHLSQSQDGTL